MEDRSLTTRREFSFLLDEDDFQLARHTDRNYTLGAALDWGAVESGAGDSHALLDAPLDGLELGGRWLARRLLGVHLKRPSWPARVDRSLVATAFTPEHIERADVQFGDRPYAFLIGYTVARAPEPDSLAKGSFWRSEATLGTIGSPVGEVVQRAVHAAARTLAGSDRPVDPAGWDHQILDSRFGVPTARYQLMRVRYGRWPLGAAGPRAAAVELLHEEGVELGYYTNAQLGMAASIGWSSARLWAAGTHPENPGLVGPALYGPRRSRSYEAFAFATAQGFAYAYNALLQGYGDWLSDYRLSRRDLETMTWQLQLGLVLGLHSVEANTGHRHDLRLVYIPESYRSPEFKGPLARGHHWGGVRVAIGETFALSNR